MADLPASVPPPAPATAPDERRALGVAAVSYATVMWGLAPLVIKQVDMPTVAFAAYRLWFGVLVYACVFAVTRRRLTWASIKTCAPGGVFFAADITVTFTAFRLTSVANATIIGALAPVVILLGAARWFGERVGRRDVVLIGLSFVGVAVVGLGSTAGSASRAGDLAALVGVFTWTAYWLFSKRARATIDPLSYIATVMLVAAILVSAFGFLTRVPMAPPHGRDWLWIWLVTIFPGALGHLCVAWSHRHVEAWLGSLVTQCSPVVGAVAAWAVLGESLTAAAVVGGSLVLGATAALLIRGARRPTAITPEDEPMTPQGSG
jgi:drug/metabolite transporter, DME family